MVALYINKDTFIDSVNPTDTHGTDVYLNLIPSPWTTRVLIDFDLSGQTNVLSSAYLVMHVNGSGGAFSTTQYIRRITSSWTENINWNTQPSYTSTNEISHVLIDYGWEFYDVTQLIKDCIDNTNYGLCFYNCIPSSNQFSSREGPNAPYLLIYYGDKFVDISTGSDSNNGNSWANAYLTVKKGIDNLPTNDNLHIAEGDYSAQAAIDLNKNLEFVCEDYGGGNASPPLTVVLPPTA